MFLLAACATRGSTACDLREKGYDGYPSAGTSTMDRITLQIDEFLPFTVCPQLADTLAEHEPGSTNRTPLRPYWPLLRSSTGCLYTVAPNHILFVQWCVWANLTKNVSPIRPEERRSDYEVLARDYAKMAHWDYPSGNRTPTQASRVSNFSERESSHAVRFRVYSRI